MEENWSSLIDFSKIPGGIISGKEGKEIESIAQQTMKRDDEIMIAQQTMEKDDDSMIAQQTMGNDDFSDLDESIIKEMDQAEQLAQNHKTVAQTNHYGKMFCDFLKENKLNCDISKMPITCLNNYLRYYYSKLKTKTGEFYSPSTLLCIRCSLNRFFNTASINKKINLVSDSEFSTSNAMLKTMVGNFLKQGGKVKQYPPLEDNDMLKLSQYFTRKDPTSLQDEIIFNIIFYFGQRGREHIKMLKTSDLEQKTDENGKSWIEITRNLESKNVKGSLNRIDFMDNKQGKMFQNSINPDKCPVVAYNLYMKKLPLNSNELFPKPLMNFYNDTWYSPKAVRGKDYLGNLMKRLSKQLNLSKPYTNHSIRATVVTTLMDQGYDPSDISAITGHKSADALRKYASFKNVTRLEEFSTVLSSKLHSNPQGSSIGQKRKLDYNDELPCCSKKSYTESKTVAITNSQESIQTLFGSNNNINIGTVNVYYK